MNRWIAIALLTALLIGACGESKPEDAGARLACSHFYNTAKDSSAGLLTDAEVRMKMQEVYDDAQHSDSRAIREESQQALAAATAEDWIAFEEHTVRLAQACVVWAEGIN